MKAYPLTQASTVQFSSIKPEKTQGSLGLSRKSDKVYHEVLYFTVDGEFFADKESILYRDKMTFERALKEAVMQYHHDSVHAGNEVLVRRINYAMRYRKVMDKTMRRI